MDVRPSGRLDYAIFGKAEYGQQKASLKDVQSVEKQPGGWFLSKEPGISKGAGSGAPFGMGG